MDQVSRDKAPDSVRRLVDRFGKNRETYKSNQYNEARVRIDFIDPMFSALGWDISNTKDKIETFKEVFYEDSLKIDGKTKAPDYSFRVGGSRKFFLEAKRPETNIRDDPAPAYQLRQYAWSAKLSLSILTDFEEFSIYDGRIKPSDGHAARYARLFYTTYDKYETEWEFISGVFSRESLLDGSFDNYAEKRKPKKEMIEVDSDFLSQIEKWRESLAKNVAKNSTHISVRELNFAIQAIIDRVVFLRICEDRGIEEFGKLRKIASGKGVYPKLCKSFDEADDRYNSGLFHFHQEKGRTPAHDKLTQGLRIDDEVIKPIIAGLYQPENPYVFSVIPADILGHVYERFLGNVINLNSANDVIIEEKPEIRRAGGVYYTPEYIVGYITQQTVGRLLEGKTIKQAETIRIVDPSCGSGSFLLVAYQYLIDWHMEKYKDLGVDNFPNDLFQGRGGQWFLTPATKKRILLNSIFGVDVDPQAVEVTKLSLLLKVLEGESSETVENQRRFLHERALPDLENNIKCGNSLVGLHFIGTAGLEVLDKTFLEEINPFDWNEAYPWLDEVGGFDAVIGNPPYIPITHIDKRLLGYYSSNYSSYEKRYDSYGLFVEKTAGSLLKRDGYLGFILPSSLLNNTAFSKLRLHLQDTVSPVDVRLLGGNVFANVNKDTMILVAKSERGRNDPITVQFYDSNTNGWGTLRRVSETTTKDLFGVGHINLSSSSDSTVLDKISSDPSIRLDSICNTFQGIVTGSDAVFVGTNEEFCHLSDREKTYLRPFLFGSDISRYGPPLSKSYLVYLTKHDSISDLPSLATRLEHDKEKLGRRRETLNGRIPWHALHWPRNHRIFEKPKILVQGIRNLTLPRRVVATLDTHNYYVGVNLAVLNMVDNAPCDIRYLLGILNSNVINYYVKHKFVDHRIKNEYLNELPIRFPTKDGSIDKSEHDRVVNLVSSVLLLHEQIEISKISHEQSLFQRQSVALNRQIDLFVCQLYGFSENEVKMFA